MNLQNLNVTELSAQEVQETDGGLWGYVLAAVGYYIHESLKDVDATVDSLEAGAAAYNS